MSLSSPIPRLHSSGGSQATPRARRALRARGLALSDVKGTGPGQRIVEADVIAAAAPVSPPGAVVRRPLGALRRVLGQRLVQSKQTVPHFYVRQAIEADRLVAFHAECKAAFPCSLNDLIVRAAALAVREFPEFRSRLEGDEIVESPSVHLGLAVGLDEGVVVPVVTEADRRSLRDLARETRRIVELARTRRIENAGAGTFTVSNLGMFGTDEFAAIINPPESAILAVGAVREQPVVRDGALQVGRQLVLTLSCDHRIIDGVAAARFVARLKQLLESPREQLGGKGPAA